MGFTFLTLNQIIIQNTKHIIIQSCQKNAQSCAENSNSWQTKNISSFCSALDYICIKTSVLYLNILLKRSFNIFIYKRKGPLSSAARTQGSDFPC